MPCPGSSAKVLRLPSNSSRAISRSIGQIVAGASSAHGKVTFLLPRAAAFHWTPSRVLLLYPQGACTMHITSPFFVVPVIVIVFIVALLVATGSKEDGHSTH